MPGPITPRVQTRLNLVMTIKPTDLEAIQRTLLGITQEPGDPLNTALVALGNVHFAQFVFLEKGTKLGVFTIYDGDFDDYIVSFVEHIGGIFNRILGHIDGGDAVIPVEQRRTEFLEFIRARDLPGFGGFSAYPGRRVFDIQQALEAMAC